MKLHWREEIPTWRCKRKHFGLLPALSCQTPLKKETKRSLITTGSRKNGQFCVWQCACCVAIKAEPYFLFFSLIPHADNAPPIFLSSSHHFLSKEMLRFPIPSVCDGRVWQVDELKTKINKKHEYHLTIFLCMHFFCFVLKQFVCLHTRKIGAIDRVDDPAQFVWSHKDCKKISLFVLCVCVCGRGRLAGITPPNRPSFSVFVALTFWGFQLAKVFFVSLFD